MDNDLLHEIARKVAARADIKAGKRRLRVVGKEELPGMTALQRDTHYQRIRDLAAIYGLDWFVRQETMHVQFVIECLKDVELQELLSKMLRAEEAMLDGVPLVEVGLIRGATCNLVA